MANCAGGDEDDGTGGELHQELQLDEVQVTPLLGVELADGADCTPAVRNVRRVTMAFADTLWAEIPGGGGEDAVLEEGAAAIVVEVVESEKLSCVVVPQLGGVCLKTRCGETFEYNIKK